jgi:uncharacterized protein YdaU (DUF1376 family)
MRNRNALTVHPAPWFRLYAANFQSDRQYRMMSLEERGLLITLLLECWINVDVPSGIDEVSLFTGYPEGIVANAFTERVKSFFTIKETSIFSPYLEEERKGYEDRYRKQVEGGKLGAIVKKQKATSRLAEGKPIGSSYPITSTSITSNHFPSSPVEQGGNRDELSSEHQQWVADYDQERPVP